MADTENKSDQLYATGAINLKQLRLAVIAGDFGSFRRAAEALSVKHTVLSRSVGQLENLIGTSLFERSSGGIKPTSAGRSVLRTARLILKQVDALVDTGRSSGRGEVGHLALGLCTSICSGNLRAALNEFKARVPQVELATVERSRRRLMAALGNGTIDVVVVPGHFPSKETNSLRLWRERILIVMPQNHGLAKRDMIQWADLRNETILLGQFDFGREVGDLLISKLAHHEERPKVELHDVSRGTIKSLTSMGMGLSFMLESEIGANSAGLVYRELQDGAEPTCLDFYAHWRGDNEDAALKRFLDLLTERYSSLPPAFGA